jgi:hypothetical protein
MLYREIIAVCSEIHTEYKSYVLPTQCILNLRMLNLVVHIVTTGLQNVNSKPAFLSLFQPRTTSGTWLYLATQGVRNKDMWKASVAGEQ